MSTVNRESEISPTGLFPTSALTIAWTLSALFVPIYRTLPPGVGNLWNLSTMGLIIATLVLAGGARPKWAGVWVLAGYGALAAGISSSGTSGLGETMPVAVQLFVLLCLAPFALRGAVIRDPKFLSSVSVSFSITQTFSAGAGVIQLLGVPVAGWTATYGRSPGLAGHPNVLGLMSAVTVLICAHALASKSRYPKFWIILVLSVNAAGLLSTGSLSSMFACAFGVLFVMAAHRIRLGRVLWIALGCGLVSWALLQIPTVALYFRSPMDRFFQVTGQTDDISTLEIRLETFKAAWVYIQNDPFMGKGIDPGNAAAFGSTAVHNVFLHAWYNGGIMLAIGIGAILVSVLVFVAQSVRARQHGLAAGVLVTVLSYALTSAMFEQSYYWLIVIVAWAALPGAKVKRSNEKLASASRPNLEEQPQTRGRVSSLK